MSVGPDSEFVEYLYLTTANKCHEAKRAESSDCETEWEGFRDGGADQRGFRQSTCVGGVEKANPGTSNRRFVKAAGTHCWRGAFLHSGMFASPLVRFVGSCLTVRPRKPRKACLPLSVDGVSFRSGRCKLEHTCWNCCLYHLGRERLFCAVSLKNPLQKAQHLKEGTHPMQLTDVVTRARFSVRAMLHARRRCFFSIFHTWPEVSAVGIGSSVFPHGS